jgi:hypothetical protein
VMRGLSLGVRWWALVASTAALAFAWPAQGHPARTSAVFLDIGETSVEAELQLPLDQLGLALDRPLDEAASSLVADSGPELDQYVKSHIVALSSDGHEFALVLRSMDVASVHDTNHLVVHLSILPPEGATPDAFSLRDDVILHRVATHQVLVSIRRDFKNGVFSDHPELLGTLQREGDTLAIDRTRGSWWQGFRSVFMLGVRHIAEGADHLLFLLVLLLPAPLLAQNGRWSAPGGALRSVKEVLKIVTAFTVGHSITLVCAAARIVHVPSRPVEILIALSILVSAIHALRPVFKGREPLVAAGFGLIHGLAFATVLADFGLSNKALALGVLGFNVGIEAMQILVVALVMPWLVLMRRDRAYAWIRTGGALLSGLAACGWIGERALGLGNPIAPVVDFAFQRGLYLVAFLAFAALALRSRRPPEP